MSITDKLLADFIIIGIICGLYLQYKGLKVMIAVPTIVERGNRALTRGEVGKAVASAGYVLMGELFEMLSIAQGVSS